MGQVNGSSLIGRMWLAMRAGFQAAGLRDLYKVFGYNRLPRFEDVYAKYQRQDIAGRVVAAPADGVWGDPPSFSDPKVQAAFTDLNDRLNIWGVFKRADCLAGMGEFSLILIGADDVTKPSDMQKPLGKGKIIYLQPYSVISAKIAQWVSDPADPRYGKPLYYQINPRAMAQAVNSGSLATGNGAAPFQDVNQLVHYTRIIHIAEDCLEDNLFGTPRMLRVYNLLDDILKVCGGSAEIFWLNARAGMQVDVDKDMDLDKDDEKALNDEMEEYSNNLRRIMRTRGVTVKPLNATVHDPQSTFNVLVQLLAATLSIPLRILIGSEAGALASQEDRAQWAVYLERRRRLFGTPYFITPMITALIILGLVDEGAASSTVTWPEAFKLSPLERGQTSAQQARSAANLLKAVPSNTPLLTRDEARKIIALASPINVDDTNDV